MTHDIQIDCDVTVLPSDEFVLLWLSLSYLMVPNSCEGSSQKCPSKWRLDSAQTWQNELDTTESSFLRALELHQPQSIVGEANDLWRLVDVQMQQNDDLEKVESSLLGALELHQKL